jgi:hypothetical protein
MALCGRSTALSVVHSKGCLLLPSVCIVTPLNIGLTVRFDRQTAECGQPLKLRWAALRRR